MADAPDWLAEAKRMRDGGMTYIAIAGALGKSESAVRQALVKLSGVRPKPGPARTHAVLYAETHAPRIIRAVLPPRDVMAAAVRRFAAGVIDRAELSRVLHRNDSRAP